MFGSIVGLLLLVLIGWIVSNGGGSIIIIFLIGWAVWYMIRPSLEKWKNQKSKERKSEIGNLDYEYKLKIYHEIESKINNCYNHKTNLFDMDKLRNDLEQYIYYDKEIVNFLDQELRDKGRSQAFLLFNIIKYNLDDLDYAMQRLREPAAKEAISQLQLTNSGVSRFTGKITYPQYIENLSHDLMEIAWANQILTPEKAQKIINDYEIGSKNNIMVTK